MAKIGQPSETMLKLTYENIPLSKRLQMSGTASMTKNSIQTEVNWGAEINRLDPHSGYTPLMVAAINGNPESVKTLIDRGADIDYKEPIKGRTALICASKKGNASCVDMLLHKGAAISVVDHNGMHPLMWAAKNGHLESCRILIGRGAGVNAFDVNDWTAIHYAAKYGHREVVDFLAHSGASIVLREKLEEGKTPLMLAAQYGRRETVLCLLDRGAKVNAITTRDELTALALAAKEGHKGTVRALIERGADANMSDSYGWTPLHFTASWGRKETARLLIRQGGANVNAMPIKKKSGTGGTTPLIIAAKGQQVDMINVLLDHGADPSINDAGSGKNPLAIAAQEGFTQSVEALIEHDVDLNVRDSRGMTPLMLAVIGGHAETIRLLLAACADITLLDAEEKSALDHARDFNFEDTYLLAILKSSAEGKATVIPWIEMDVPKMIRGSICGGPSVFLNSICYQKDGMFAGLFLRPSLQDVHLVHDLCMLSAAIARSRYTQPLDCDDLNSKLEEVDHMLLSIMDTQAFAVDQNLSLALSLQSYPEATLQDGGFDYKYFAPSMTTGPLALYLENDLSKMLSAYPMTRLINELFTNCTRSAGKVVGDRSYGSRTYLLRARYCPAMMFSLEGISKFILLFLVFLNVQAHKSSHASQTSRSGFGHAGNNLIGWLLSDLLLEQVLQIWVVSSLVYELGSIEEKAWSVSPSLAVDPHELKAKRRRNAINHFFCDVWHKFDFVSLLLLLTWTVLKYTKNTPEGNTLGYSLLSLSAIPLCIGLLRYPGAFYRSFGQLVLSIFIITQKLLYFVVIFGCTGIGFGIACTGLFYETALFTSPFETFRTLFNAMNYNYDLYAFDSATQQSPTLGVVLILLFIFWTVVVLMNIVVAYIVSIYLHVNDLAAQNWLLIKAKHVQQYLLVHEKSPLCMLPAPFNIISAVFYPMHQIYTWRARLYINRGVLTSISVAGTIADWCFKLAFFIPAVFAEFYKFISDQNQKWEERYIAILLAPIELVSCACALFYKIQSVDSWYASVLLKSRLAKGRLRVAYFDSRDTNECIGVDDNPDVKPIADWKDNGGGGKNTGNSKYARVRPEGEGEATILEPLGDQSNVWAKELGGMVDRTGIARTRKNDDGTMVGPYDDDFDMGENDSGLGDLALGSLPDSKAEQKDGGDPTSINPKGVDLGKGKGEFYDHKYGFNAGRNELEIAKGLSGSPSGISGTNPFKDLPPKDRPGTSGAKVGETDDDAHSYSMMSDISSGELMQRFPPQATSANDFFIESLTNGMFTDKERIEIFERVLPEWAVVREDAYKRAAEKAARIAARADHVPEEDNDMKDDPLFIMLQALEDRIVTNEHATHEQFHNLVYILQSIKQKTDAIKERPKLKPADFE